jgi:hypothetical protein
MAFFAMMRPGYPVRLYRTRAEARWLYFPVRRPGAGWDLVPMDPPEVDVEYDARRGLVRDRAGSWTAEARVDRSGAVVIEDPIPEALVRRAPEPVP